MRLLFEMDAKNYDPNGTVFCRPSVRGSILRDGTVAMVTASSTTTTNSPAAAYPFEGSASN